MMKRFPTLRRFIREALMAEGTAPEDLAGFYEDASDWGMKAITLYSPALLEQNMDDIGLAVVGYIAAQKPKNPCAGAWEIKMAGGRGYGRVLYPAMFAAVNGPLMPDRHSTTPAAVSGWKKQSSRDKVPLDNAEADMSKKLTPSDKSDDCDVRSWTLNDKTGKWGGDEIIDNAYAPKGNEKAVLDGLLSNHEAFVEKLRDRGVDLSSFLAELSREGVKRFNMETLS